VFSATVDISVSSDDGAAIRGPPAAGRLVAPCIRRFSVAMNQCFDCFRPMRAHYLQHVPFEGLGSIEPWLRARGFSVTATRFFEDPALPDPRGIDLLVVMGGPMSVNDDASLPWLVDEKRFVRAAIDANIPVLGICLGAQLIASAMGARVQPGREKELGWFPVQAVHAAHAPGLARPDDVAE